MDTLNNYIAGQFVPARAARTLPLVDPCTGDTVGCSPISDRADIDEAVAAADVAFGQWRRTTPKARQRALLRLADLLEANTERLVDAQCRNTGQPRAMVAQEEVVTGADHLRFFAGAARILEGRAAAEYLEGHTSHIRREPLGVIAQVAPWNYPLLMAIWKIAPALATGNTVVLKPSDTTPESTLVLAELTRDLFPEGAVNVILGDRDTGESLISHPGVAMVAITGSVRAGIEVAQTAARHLKPAHLELGGNAPVLVFADAALDTAAQTISEAAFFNAGQDCTAASRILVQDSCFNDMVEHLSRVAQAITTGPPNDTQAFYGPLNNCRQFDAISAKIASLPPSATIVTGGHRVGDRGYFFAPTVITGVNQRDPIVADETFGPVLTVQPFHDEAHAVALANDTRYGLAASVWTADHARAQRVSADLDFGAVWVNSHIPLVAEMPHGGFKHSGHGKDLSMYAVEAYTRIKHVMSALA